LRDRSWNKEAGIKHSESQPSLYTVAPQIFASSRTNPGKTGSQAMVAGFSSHSVATPGELVEWRVTA
jgi:hypothetical protein